jgi:hypothetical protein
MSITHSAAQSYLDQPHNNAPMFRLLHESLLITLVSGARVPSTTTPAVATSTTTTPFQWMYITECITSYPRISIWVPTLSSRLTDGSPSQLTSSVWLQYGPGLPGPSPSSAILDSASVVEPKQPATGTTFTSIALPHYPSEPSSKALSSTLSFLSVIPEKPIHDLASRRSSSNLQSKLGAAMHSDLTWPVSTYGSVNPTPTLSVKSLAMPVDCMIALTQRSATSATMSSTAPSLSITPISAPTVNPIAVPTTTNAGSRSVSIVSMPTQPLAPPLLRVAKANLARPYKDTTLDEDDYSMTTSTMTLRTTVTTDMLPSSVLPSRTSQFTGPAPDNPKTTSIPKSPTISHADTISMSVMPSNGHCPYPYPSIHCGAPRTTLLTRTTSHKVPMTTKDKPSASWYPYPGQCSSTSLMTQ